MSEMSNRYDQHGSAHVVIVVCLLVALIGTLGIVFYQNFMMKSSQAAQQQELSATPAKKDETATDKKNELSEFCLPLEKLCINYPSTWSVRGGPVVSISHIDATHTEEMTAEKYHLNNAEGLTVLYVQSGIGGLGMICEPERESQYEIYETHTTQLKGIPGTSTNRSSSAYAVKEIVKTSSGYTVRMFVTNLKALQSPGSLRGCPTLLDGMFEGRNLAPLPSMPNDKSFSVYIGQTEFGKYDSVDTTYKTRDEAVSALKSKESELLFTALQSVHYK